MNVYRKSLKGINWVSCRYTSVESTFQTGGSFAFIKIILVKLPFKITCKKTTWIMYLRLFNLYILYIKFCRIYKNKNQLPHEWSTFKKHLTDLADTDNISVYFGMKFFKHFKCILTVQLIYFLNYQNFTLTMNDRTLLGWK